MEMTARGLSDRLRAAGHTAYFAGGCVRDLVRGETPKDIDIATDARPDEVQKIFPRTYAVGAHFGVIVVLENDLQFEVATFPVRRRLSRRPAAGRGALLDARKKTRARRDFTINGMFFDPITTR